jgi:hypothetical protein
MQSDVHVRKSMNSSPGSLEFLRNSKKFIRRFMYHVHALKDGMQRIKVMQCQVNADEEEGHRRLEDDIRRSHIVRARRSTGYGSRFAIEPFCWAPRSPPVDPMSALESEDSPDDASPIPDRQREQASTLTKLAGAGAPSHSPVKSPEPV